MKLFLLILIFSTFSTCSEVFDRRSELITYLSTFHNIQNLENNHVFLIPNNVCGACSAKPINFIFKILKKSNKDFLVVFTKKDKVLTKKLLALNPKIKIINDFDHNIDKNGLSFSDPVYLYFNKNEVAYWNFVVDKSFKSIEKNLNKTQ